MNKLLIVPVSALALLVSCGEVGSFGISGSGNQSGGSVGRYLKFQGTKFRTGGAHRAHLGAIGIKRTAGDNVFELKRIPKLSKIGVSQTAVFTKTTEGLFKVTAEAKFKEIEDLGISPSAEGDFKRTSKQTGIYTIIYLSDIAGLVDQLNDRDNDRIRNYLRRTRDARIVTSVIKVKTHKITVSSEYSFDIQGIEDGDADDEQSGTVSNDEKSGGKGTKIEIDGSPGLSLADGTTYAYEYGRILWDVQTGLIADILTDRPSRWYNWSDQNNHHLQGVSADPSDLRR